MKDMKMLAIDLGASSGRGIIGSYNGSKLTLREKLLTFLSGWERRCGQKTFQIPFDRAALAVYLGVNRTALSRELSAMQAEGLLEFYKNSFKLLF